MTTRSQYLNKANDRRDPPKSARSCRGGVALLQVSQCFILLAEYVAARHEHGTARRENEQRTASPYS
jgi:hypothetical protein